MEQKKEIKHVLDLIKELCPEFRYFYVSMLQYVKEDRQDVHFFNMRWMDLVVEVGILKGLKPIKEIIIHG